MVGIENFVNSFESLGLFILKLITDIQAMYMITFLFFTFLVFGIVLAIIHKVPGFGRGGKPNHYGNILSLVIALVTSFAVYSLTERSMEEVVLRVLPIYGIFGGAILGVFFVVMIIMGFSRQGEGRWNMALLGIGLLMVISGYFITRPNIQMYGWIIAFIAIIVWIGKEVMGINASA